VLAVANGRTAMVVDGADTIRMTAMRQALELLGLLP
jgi:hypothetical protein